MHEHLDTSSCNPAPRARDNCSWISINRGFLVFYQDYTRQMSWLANLSRAEVRIDRNERFCFSWSGRRSALSLVFNDDVFVPNAPHVQARLSCHLP